MTGFAEWIGRRSEAEDVVTERLDASFRAIFGSCLAALPAGLAPLGLHWCLAPSIAAMAELGLDGHPAESLELPPVPAPRRMWAGGWIEILDPLRVGDRVRRLSTIADISRKEGRSGELWFVGIERDYHTQRGPALRERHDIVYRPAARPLSSAAERLVREDAQTPRPSGRSRVLTTSPTLLFRYSAISFNGHRIHYDQPYAVEVEGYEGLVVHAPVQATLLLNLAAEDVGIPRRFVYRGVSPAIAGQDLVAHRGAGRDSGHSWIQDRTGRVSMTASASGHIEFPGPA
jgi:3-methylfumaryl-CoA hydratase